MESEIIAGIVSLAIALLAFHGGRALNKSHRNLIDVQTLANLADQVSQLQTQYTELKGQLEKVSNNNRVLWQYVYALIEQLRNKKITPIKPPVELESDPLLMKLLKVK